MSTESTEKTNGTDDVAGPAPDATAKAPRSASRWHVRQRDIAVLAMALLVFGGGLGWWVLRGTYQSVWLMNELDVSVTVELDGTTVALASSAKVKSQVRSGVHPVRVRLASGELLEEHLVAIPAGKDIAAYSVLGAGLLYLRRIEYTQRESGNGGSNSVEVYAGERFTAHDDIDYPFEPPPTTITTSSKEGAVIRRHFGIAPGGWDAAVGYLVSQGRLARAAALCRDVVRANPENLRAQSCAEVLTAQAEGYDAALVFARGLLARQPESVVAHRIFTHLLRWAGRKEELRTYYQGRLKAALDAVVLQAMLSRSEPPEIARAQLTALLARHPGDAFVRRSAAWADFASGHYMEAEPLFAGLKDDPEYRNIMEDHVQTLVALGRTQEAAELVRKLLDAPGVPDVRLVILYAQLVRLPGTEAFAGSADAFVKRLAEGPDGDRGADIWLATLLGNPVEGQALERIKSENLRTAARIQLAAGRDPVAAWKACAGAPMAALRNLAPEVAVLLGAEFERAGDPALAATLYQVSNALYLPAAIVSEYIHGGAKHPDLEWLDPAFAAALDLARARTFDAFGKPSAALYAAIEKKDVLEGIVTRARRSWPAVGQGPGQGREVVLTRLVPTHP